MFVDVQPPDSLTAEDVAAERLDLIIVPTARLLSAELPGLSLAMEIAAKFRSRLVVLCSKDAKPQDFPWRRARAMGLDRLNDLEPWVIDFAQVRSWKLPAAASARTQIARLRRPVDTGAKRNVGLILARHANAGNVLFLDDDIKPAVSGPTLTSLTLGYAIQQLRESKNLRAIGFTAAQMPDNSVVCHLRRRLGLNQDIFLGAGALLVKMAGRVPPFPEAVYNEDWLFMMALCASAPNYRQALGWAGDVHQSACALYTSDRAQSEEPGDLIAEALMNLLEDHGSVFMQLASTSFWKKAVEERISLLKAMSNQLKMNNVVAGGDAGLKQEIEVVWSALRTYLSLSAADVVDHLAALKADQSSWERVFQSAHKHRIEDLLEAGRRSE